jgi:hypothetical protein
VRVFCKESEGNWEIQTKKTENIISNSDSYLLKYNSLSVESLSPTHLLNGKYSGRNFRMMFDGSDEMLIVNTHNVIGLRQRVWIPSCA